jgi:microsomal dipeptidase-like Zn-dependent dipeptidase
MIKTIALYTTALLVLLAGYVFFFVFPNQVDRAINRVDRPDPPLVASAEAVALHRTLTVVDLHADPLLWKRDLLERLDYGHVDLPRLEAGNVALQVMGVATKSPAGQNYDSNPSDSDVFTPMMIANRQPSSTWTSLYGRAVYQAEKLEALQARAPDRLQIVLNAEDLDGLVAARAESRRPVGTLLALEGAHALEGKLENLDGLFDAGYRMIGMAHFFDNEVSGSMHGEEKYGLTDLGRQVVQRAEELGMVIDLAHSSSAAVADMLDMVTKPVVVSHGGVKATCDYNRNLDDDQIRRVAANGGVIGIGYWDAAVCDTTPAGIVAAMNHIRDLVGVDAIGLGSDYDGGTTTQFDTSELAVLTQALMDEGYSEADIRKIMGENALGVLRAGLPR